MWLVASIPFWIIGGFCLLTAAVAVPYRKPGETRGELLFQILVFLFFTGFFFVIAAKIAA